jgi:hypothetical protein
MLTANRIGLKTRYRRSAWRQTRRVPRPAFVNANSKTRGSVSPSQRWREILRPWDRAAREDANYEVAAAPLENDWIAAVSSSWISNTLCSLVVFSRSRTWTDGFNSLISAA